MKLCVIGGAGARSAFLTKSLVKSAREIRVDHIVLLDNNEEHLRTYGQISKELARRMEPSLTFDITSDARGALTGADYIITTIRAGGDAGRLFDEKTCLAHGVLGQETTGAGVFAMAIRSVPTLVYYCTLAREVSNPGHLIFNFTNPSGIITQALRSCGFANVYGICDAPSGFIKQLEEILNVPYGALDIECYGLNHLSWFRNAKLDGRDVQEELLNNPRTYQHSEMRLFTREMARLSGECMLNEYLYFYYRREKSLSMVQKAEHPRGEMIYLINRELETQLAQMELPRDFEKAFNLYMNAYGKRENGEDCRMVLSVPNEGAIDGLEDDDVVEITCDIHSDGAHPIHIGVIDEFQLQQIKRLKYFERCTIQAILHDDRDSAVKGLALHPLVNDFELAETLSGIFFKEYASFIHMNEAPGQ